MILEKQGQRRNQHRRILDEKFKERNRRLHIDVGGQGKWYFYQSESNLQFWWGSFQKQAKWGLEHIGKVPDEQILDFWRGLVGQIKTQASNDQKREHLEPWPSEKDMRHDYHRYRDDPGPCDQSGRGDLRPSILKKIAQKEIIEFKTIEHGKRCNCFDCCEESHIGYCYNQDAEYAQIVRDGLFDYGYDDYDFFEEEDALLNELSCYDDVSDWSDIYDLVGCDYKVDNLPEKLKLMENYCQNCQSFMTSPGYCDCVHNDTCILYHPDDYYEEKDLPDALEL